MASGFDKLCQSSNANVTTFPGTQHVVYVAQAQKVLYPNLRSLLEGAFRAFELRFRQAWFSSVAEGLLSQNRPSFLYAAACVPELHSSGAEAFGGGPVGAGAGGGAPMGRAAGVACRAVADRLAGAAATDAAAGTAGTWGTASGSAWRVLCHLFSSASFSAALLRSGVLQEAGSWGGTSVGPVVAGSVAPLSPGTSVGELISKEFSLACKSCIIMRMRSRAGSCSGSCSVPQSDPAGVVGAALVKDSCLTGVRDSTLSMEALRYKPLPWSSTENPANKSRLRTGVACGRKVPPSALRSTPSSLLLSAGAGVGTMVSRVVCVGAFWGSAACCASCFASPVFWWGTTSNICSGVLHVEHCVLLVGVSPG